ncbi:unnamed protein product [Thlaspi arvense]|uniref:Uncharacterized protein n=1 Tax=Thlaspi arvense TaxID=13288 RepID=A0AAU9RV03_THLAR|nr:unnamed protein product [Thlaspi arvense]
MPKIFFSLSLLATMVDANNASVGNPVWAIGPQYCVPYNVELVIDRKPMHRIKFMVTDVQGNLLFKVKRHLLRLHDQGVLIDSVGNHVVTLRRKIMTAHHRWEVHRGDSTSNPILSVKTSAAIQLQTKLQVFKANKAEEICDFRVEGSWSESSYVIYAGESSTIIAQVCS